METGDQTSNATMARLLPLLLGLALLPPSPGSFFSLECMMPAYATVYEPDHRKEYETQCRTRYGQECLTEYRTEYQAKTEEVCHGGSSEECHLIQDTVYERKCNVRYVQSCRQVEDVEVAEECKIVSSIVCDESPAGYKGHHGPPPLAPSLPEHDDRHLLLPVTPLPEPACRQIPHKACSQVPRKVQRQKCSNVPKEECVPVPRKIPRRVCQQVPKRSCHQVQVSVPVRVPFEACHEVPEQECHRVLRRIPVPGPKTMPWKNCNGNEGRKIGGTWGLYGARYQH